MSSLISILTVAWYILEIFLGVGFVIFVHELGHFAVAKLCGVKCEKFYLGFDIGGWKFCKFRWGETEYGIGILPLGGYVKMLGQEDNPAKLKEEIERAKTPQAVSPGSEVQPSATLAEIAEAEQALYDPRSYLAKSVPKRMAIIAAGVVMNVIFAFLMATVAYMIGVDQMIPVVGNVSPGEAAWRADIRPGDRILQIGDRKINRYDDVRKSIPFSDLSKGVEIKIERFGVKDVITKILHPDSKREMPTIGVLSSESPVLRKPETADSPVAPHSVAEKIKDQLRGGDRIVAIDGEKIERYTQIEAALISKPDQPLNLTLACSQEGEKEPIAGGKLVDVTLPPQPMRTLGLDMEMGEITAIQDDSPAQSAGIRVGDKIIKIDGQPVGDPMRLPDSMRRRSGETVKLTIQRGKDAAPLEISVKLRQADWSDEIIFEDSPVTIPQLGIAYFALNRVAAIEPESPAAKAGITSGTIFESAQIIPPNKQKVITFDFVKNRDWPIFFQALQMGDPKSTIELTIKGDGETKKIVKLQTVEAADWFNDDRGLLYEPDTVFIKAESVGEAVRWGAGETKDSLMMVVNILRNVGTQISLKSFGGPGSIFWMAYLSAKHGFASLLLFLTMLSANLAVLNVLPIPVLDGGHLVFLTYEGIRGKPASERIQIGLSIVGLVLLLSLMIFVIGMDITRFTSWITGK